ncbi:uncharacterized protein HMPREF1541_01311 [Cyphellophora europaea CBS 101466]|uniref:F-box domain-containing protein n=1 Tax=Cyphellophora europaea (strain CBS 101466) TaxID=1220924 RepID=W2SEG0_CYPE1|nr:uncharacterized protein HMPREF1541_01311 [Cyphellophora europaea CBS 101466]ETN47121.1 hypothetical protein HMPREF1541_01311 [Cyphellophora europaea CBS 101466]
MTPSRSLLSLPLELLSYVFLHLSTESFVQIIWTCKQLFNLASQSRDAVLLHLNNVPGIKLGLSTHMLTTPELFLILRQRASANLYGAAIHADCKDVRLRTGTLDASASCLRNAQDYFNVSLALKESLKIRHWSVNCRMLKEHIPSPYADGTGKILQVVQGKHTVSVLYKWIPDETPDEIACQASPTLRPQPSHLGTRRNTIGRGSDHSSVPVTEETLSKQKGSRSGVQYHLVHYNAYNSDRPEFFIIFPPSPDGARLDWKDSESFGEQDPIPAHLAVHSRLKCVIIWDLLPQNSKPPYLDRRTSVVISYVADNLPVATAGVYTTKILYPLRKPANINMMNIDDDDDNGAQDSQVWEENHKYLKSCRARASAFSDNGNRLKLYSAGSLAPYAAIPTPNSYMPHREDPSQDSSWRLHNRFLTARAIFRADAPFYGTHRYGSSSSEDDAVPECTLSYLFLAWRAYETASPALDRENETLYIAQSSTSVDSDDCEHHISPDLPIAAGGNYTRRIVARLCGLAEHWAPTTMTALDTMCVSKKGTRIAIAVWNKILVYALDPAIFVEPWAGEVTHSEDGSDNGHGSDDESVFSTHSDSDNSNAQSSIDAPPIIEIIDPFRLKISSKAMIKATEYYTLVDDPDFGEIVELWPVVLESPGGVVARKMMWGNSTKDDEAGEDGSEETDEGEEEDEEEGDNRSSENNDTVSEASVRTSRPSKSSPAALNANAATAGDNGAATHSVPADDVVSDLDDMHLASATEDNEDDDADLRIYPTDFHPDRRREAREQLAKLASSRDASAKAPSMAIANIGVNINSDDDDDNVEDVPLNDPSLAGNGSVAAFTAGAAERPSLSRNEIPAAAISMSPVADRNNDNTAAATESDADWSSGKPSEFPRRSRNKGKRPLRPRRKRRTEDELVVLTDRGLQVWDLGARAKGRRGRRWLLDEPGG